MTTDTPPPRRNWHLTRWLIVFIVATFGWSGWRAYAFRSALAEARALGWKVKYTDPVEEIRRNWKATFKKETWLDGVTELGIETSESFEQNLTIVHRLNPMGLQIYGYASTLRDLSTLKGLARLQVVGLSGCTALVNVDELRNLPALREVYFNSGTKLTNMDALRGLSALEGVTLDQCSGLTNVDALTSLSNLQSVWLWGCTGLTKESVAPLKAALPNTKFWGP